MAVRTFTVLIQQEAPEGMAQTQDEAVKALAAEFQMVYDGEDADFGDGNFLIVGVEEGDERFWREWHLRRRRTLPNWERDDYQFPRLLSEMVANIALTDEQFETLADAMDLHISDVDELLDRAQTAWEKVKEEAVPVVPKSNDFVCMYPACDCKITCRTTGRKVR